MRFGFDIGALDIRNINGQAVLGCTLDKGIHRKRTGGGFAKIAISHRAGKTHHIAFCQQCQLDGAYVAESEKQRAVFAHPCAERSKIDMRQNPRRTVTAAQAHQHFRRGDAAGSDLLEIGDTLCVRTSKPLEAAAARLLVGYGKAGIVKAG